MIRVPLTRVAGAALVLAGAVAGLLFVGDGARYRPARGQAVTPVLARTTSTGEAAHASAAVPPPHSSPSPTPPATTTPSPSPTARPMPAGGTQLKGQILFLTDREGRDPWGGSAVAYVMNADGSHQRRLARPGLYDELARWEPWSRGRQQAAIVRWNTASASYDLFIHNAADGWTFYATGGRAAEYSPAWSPVDNRIAYVTGEDGNDEIHVWDLDTHRDRRLTCDPQWDKHPTWSPDGTRLAFWSNRATGRKQIWSMTADGQGVRNLSDNPWNDWDPVWAK